MQATLPSSTIFSLRSPAGSLERPSVTFDGHSKQLWSPRAAGVGARKLSCTRASLGEERRSSRGPRLLHSRLCHNVVYQSKNGVRKRTFPTWIELRYFGKLSAGCVAGAILVKYGSLAVPDITNPNIDQALLIIGTPVLTSLVLLTLASVLSSD